MLTNARPPARHLHSVAARAAAAHGEGELHVLSRRGARTCALILSLASLYQLILLRREPPPSPSPWVRVGEQLAPTLGRGPRFVPCFRCRHARATEKVFSSVDVYTRALSTRWAAAGMSPRSATTCSGGDVLLNPRGPLPQSQALGERGGATRPHARARAPEAVLLFMRSVALFYLRVLYLLF
jgi:hypothetical protein